MIGSITPVGGTGVWLFLAGHRKTGLGALVGEIRSHPRHDRQAAR